VTQRQYNNKIQLAKKNITWKKKKNDKKGPRTKLIYMTQFYSLSRIVHRIDELLRPAMEKSFWVKAEVSSSRLKAGSFYCDLVESDGNGSIVSQVRCSCWSRDLSAIKARFKAQGLDLQLENGVVVGVLCKIQFHPVYGLSFKIIDMDPAFALGELELKKRAIIEKLQNEELTDKNKLCFCPQLPIKIGLITSKDSAAYHDFVQTITSSGFGYRIFMADSNVQGKDTEKTILKSLSQLKKIETDIVVIIRGGGSKTDLSWLDNEKIARIIADFPVPVWTGIGHEIDTSVLDFVAARYFKTPTAVAEEIVACFENTSQYLAQARHDLNVNWNENVKNRKHFFEEAKRRVTVSARSNLKIQTQHLIAQKKLLHSSSKQLIAHLNEKFENLKINLLQQAKNYCRENSEQLHYTGSMFKQKSGQWLREKNIELNNHKKNYRPQKIETYLKFHRSNLSKNTQSLQSKVIKSKLYNLKESLSAYKKVLTSYDPETCLKRGYSIVRKKNSDKVVRISELKVGDEIIVKVAGGVLQNKVESITIES